MLELVNNMQIIYQKLNQQKSFTGRIICQQKDDLQWVSGNTGQNIRIYLAMIKRESYLTSRTTTNFSKRNVPRIEREFLLSSCERKIPQDFSFSSNYRIIKQWIIFFSSTVNLLWWKAQSEFHIQVILPRAIQILKKVIISRFNSLRRLRNWHSEVNISFLWVLLTYLSQRVYLVLVKMIKVSFWTCKAKNLALHIVLELCLLVGNINKNKLA